METTIKILFHKQMVRKVKQNTKAHTVMHVKNANVGGQRVNYLLIKGYDSKGEPLEVKVGGEQDFEDYTENQYNQAIVTYNNKRDATA